MESNTDQSEMTKDELSLLLFLESCHVDQGGLVDARRMNADDFEIATRWNKEGLIEFGRLYSKDLERFYPKANYTILTDKAMDLAHAERKARGIRMMTKRSWRKTSEK